MQDNKITPRNNQKRGKAEELMVSRDSKICGAVLRVYSKKKDSTFLLKRPVQNMIPFEIMNCAKEDYKNVLYAIANLPQRKAAVTGQLMRRMNNFLTSYGRSVLNITGSKIKRVTF